MNEILIYEDIGDWGMSARRFADQMPETGTVSVRINSPGGDVFAGIAIATRLWGRDSVAYIDGIAASAASVIAAGARKVIAATGSMLMIHDPWTMAVGNADDLSKEMAVLDKVGDQIASIYARKAGGTTEEWRDRLKAETWLSAEEAKALGLVDEISDSLAIAAHAGLARYNYANKETQMDILNKGKILALENELSARDARIAELSAELEKLTQEQADATARAEEAQAHAEAADAALQAERAEVEARIDAAKKDALKAYLADNAPPSVDGREAEPECHFDKHAALYAAGKFAEASEYMAKHRAAILRGE